MTDVNPEQMKTKELTHLFLEHFHISGSTGHSFPLCV